MIQEIELGRLVPNRYNPRKRMTKKHLISLKKSLSEDGLLQTLLVRPIEGGKYEVVAGMRRFYCLKELYDDRHKIACTIQDIDDYTAMIRSYKENIEREEVNPIDDAGWYFNMLGLKEEQLFTPLEGYERAGALNAPLPREKNPEVIQLSKELGVSGRIIGERLPLLALPVNLQELVMLTFLDEIGDKIPLGIVKAHAIARLRLIGDKDKAHAEMFNVWRKWGKEDVEFINEMVTKILDTYKEEAEKLLKELKTIEENLDNRINDLNIWTDKDIGDWLNPKSKKSIYSDMPEELTDSENDGITIPKLRERKKDENERNFSDEIYNILDEFVMDITRNDILEDKKNGFEVKIDKFEIGLRELEEGLCVYCGSEMENKAIEKKIKDIREDIDKLEDKIEIKDEIRGDAEKLKRELGGLIRKYDAIVSKYTITLEKLKDAEKISEKEYNMKIEKYKLEDIV